MRKFLSDVLKTLAIVLTVSIFVYSGEAFSYTGLTEMNQNLALVQGPQAGLSLERPASSFKIAAVHFIAGDNRQVFDNDGKDNEFADPSDENCKKLGFAASSCPSGLFNIACPYNDKIYDKCCDSAYAYTDATCPSPKIISADSCGGKFRCYCNSSAYPYASCTAPQIQGSICSDDTGTHYASCSCPNTNNGQWGCKEYYPAPCGHVCKTPNSDNCHNRDHKDVGYGCESWWSDCPSKCERPYYDNCRNQTAVIIGCPDNASCTYFADCSSKISSWSCNSGYEKSGNGCIKKVTKCEDMRGYYTSRKFGTGWTCLIKTVEIEGLSCYKCSFDDSKLPDTDTDAYCKHVVGTACTMNQRCVKYWAECPGKCRTCG